MGFRHSIKVDQTKIVKIFFIVSFFWEGEKSEKIRKVPFLYGKIIQNFHNYF